MSSLEKKRKTTTTKKKMKLSPNPSLPYDVLLSIVARISRLYYPTLSLVSKSFRSLLASPELYKNRSILGHTESCLYVCLRFYRGYHWFTLCHQTLTNDTIKKKSTGYVLAKVPKPSFLHKACFSSLVAVGSDIYNIHAPSSVSILDCKSHTWHEAPSVPEKQLLLSASVLGQKIYVAGGYNDIHNSDSFFEVLDTKTQIWETKPIPCNDQEINYNFLYSKSTCIDGKFHVMTETEGVIAYNSKEGNWEQAGRLLEDRMLSDSYCEINNVLYSVSNRTVIWYDTEPEVSRWRYLEGLEGLPTFPPGVSVRLADFGGKLAVLWDEDLVYRLSDFVVNSVIWCAVIALERRKSCEVYGKVEWFDHVLTVPTGFDFVKVLAATV